MKILFFDYWLKGIANFNRLMPEIKHQYPYAEVKMLHVGSWKEPQDKLVNEHEGFKSYDISYYKTWNLYKVLKKEKPDVLIMLNIYFIGDKTIINLGKKFGIKTIYLAHGRFGNNMNIEDHKAVNQEIKNNLSSKIRKDTFFTLLNYGLSTLLNKKPQNFFKTLKGIITDPLSMTLNTKFSEELNADKILVYYESDKKLLVEERRFPIEKVEIIGNPELDSFVNLPLISDKVFLKQTGINKPYLLYLDDGWVQANLMEKDRWIRHLKDINRLSKKTGKGLVIKLHPRTPIDDYKVFFNEEDIKAFKNEIDFKSLINYSDCVVSLASTTISLALFMNKRIISPRFGEVKEAYINYPKDVIHYSYSESDFKDWISNEQATVSNLKYLEDNFQKCDGKVINRIINKILN